MKEITETTKKTYIRKRHENEGSLTRPRKLSVRLTVAESNELASIQGLLFRYGNKEKISELFSKLFLPSLREYVKIYAEKAKAERQLKKPKGN